MDPADLMEKVRRIEIRTRRIVQNQTAGAWQASFKGRGIEFAEVREFQEGDELRAIDWNVSARMNSPYVKLFTEEREQNVFLLVDRSSSGDFGTAGVTKAELAAEVAAVLAFSATMNKDRVGLLLYSDREELHLDPARGHQHVLRIIRELLSPGPESRKTDLAGGIEWLLKGTLRRSIVFILSDLMTADFSHPLRTLAQRHEVVVLQVSDPLERKMPKLPALAVTDLETGLPHRIARGGSRRLAKRVEKRQEELLSTCRRSGVDLLQLDTATDYLPAIMELFARRMNRR